VVEKVDHVAATPDYFMEIDTEMGSLFDETIDERARATHTDKMVEALEAAGATVLPASNRIQNVDQFERELEEDFRQSLLETSSKMLRSARLSTAALPILKIVLIDQPIFNLNGKPIVLAG